MDRVAHAPDTLRHQVAAMAAAGLSVPMIAVRLGLSEATVAALLQEVAA